MFLSDSEESLTGNVRVTIASQTTSPIINDALSRFHQTHPKATITNTVMNGPDVILSLSNKIIHFGICPAVTKSDDFVYFHIFKEYCAFYCGPAIHCLARPG